MEVAEAVSEASTKFQNKTDEVEGLKAGTPRHANNNKP